MAQYIYRANLSASSFPMLATDAGRTVIIPQYDNTFDRTVVSSGDRDRDVGIPQIYYCENVMPSQRGFQSVGYEQRIPVSTIGTFYNAYRLRDSTGNVIVMATTSAGLVAYRGGAWSLKYTAHKPKQVTVANVNGVSYIFISRTVCLKWNEALTTFSPVTLTGLDLSKTLGLTTCQGYLIAYGETTVSWSSTVDPTDFTPSLATGAGGGAVEGIKADITAAVQILNGFILYSRINSVAVIYSGNARYPFNFREVVGSGGISDMDYVSLDSASGEQFAYTTSGLQTVSPVGAKPQFPDVTDFLAGRVLDTYDIATGKFTRRGITTPLKKKLTVVSNRYLVVSYGITSLTDAIIVDLAMERYGKLHINHADIVDWNIADTVDVDTPRRSIGVMQADGTVKTVSFDPVAANQEGVIVLGKYQHVRARHIAMQSVDVDNIYAGLNCKVSLLTSFAGKDTDIKTDLVDTSPNSISHRYYCNNTHGLNHSLAITGAFDLNSIVLTYTLGGDR